MLYHGEISIGGAVRSKKNQTTVYISCQIVFVSSSRIIENFSDCQNNILFIEYDDIDQSVKFEECYGVMILELNSLSDKPKSKVKYSIKSLHQIVSLFFGVINKELLLRGNDTKENNLNGIRMIIGILNKVFLKKLEPNLREMCVL